MSKNFRWNGCLGMAAIGVALVLGGQACGEKQVVEQAPAKPPEAAAPSPAAERSESKPSSDKQAPCQSMANSLQKRLLHALMLG